MLIQVTAITVIMGVKIIMVIIETEAIIGVITIN
jgi:hypothetical protein